MTKADAIRLAKALETMAHDAGIKFDGVEVETGKLEVKPGEICLHQTKGMVTFVCAWVEDRARKGVFYVPGMSGNCLLEFVELLGKFKTTEKGFKFVYPIRK